MLEALVFSMALGQPADAAECKSSSTRSTYSSSTRASTYSRERPKRESSSFSRDRRRSSMYWCRGDGRGGVTMSEHKRTPQHYPCNEYGDRI